MVNSNSFINAEYPLNETMPYIKVENGTTTETDENKKTVVWSLILFIMLILVSIVMIFIFVNKLMDKVREDKVELLDEDR